MRKINLDELKQIQLNLLKEVHDFCMERGLRYSLGGGTLLGAVRHKGYIPWDDDIDLMMPRIDYDIFVKEFSGYKSFLVCGAYENDKSFIYPFAKVYDNRTQLKEKDFKGGIGVNIDVFPIDGYPNKNINKWEFFFFIVKMKFMMKAFYLKTKEKRSWKKIPFLILSDSYVKERANHLTRKYKCENTVFWGVVMGRYEEKECYSHTVFSEYIELEFENLKFYAIKDYDTYLMGHYGDYMVLPPVEKQKRHHQTEAFWID